MDLGKVHSLKCIEIHQMLCPSLQQKNDQETRKEHEQSQKYKNKVKYFHLFRDMYNKEIYDILVEVRDFTQRYKLRSNVLEIHFKEEDYNINIFLGEISNVETKLYNIIRTCDWENTNIKMT